MTKKERALTKRWVETWKKAGPELERIRREEVKRTKTAQGMQALAGCVTWTLRDQPPRTTSGLVEQQAWFSKLHQP
ncbi:MAG: hypothetical protein AAB676_01205 [Verrucomicrobiota bacterium]